MTSDASPTPAPTARRRRVVAATAVAGASLLGISLSTKPDSRRFYGLTLAVAATWTAGSIASGPLPVVGPAPRERLRRDVVEPVAVGVGAFAAFYGAALVARRIEFLDRALSSVLSYAHEGSDSLVLLTTLANGAAEETFFRGALYDAVGAAPVVRSTAAYVVATSATRNPALVLASGVMGTLLAVQRRSTGGLLAPTLTHLTWSALMLRFVPPLFRRKQAG